ncbi:MAG: dihydropteroate synthase [Bacteroidota bacterium]|jgi:dihydropteroate synthase|nr:dihydropteroate synthase [Chitinophagaceae bacterium]
MYQLHSGNDTLKIESPLIMGVVNCTPDSFYAASRTTTIDQAKAMIEQMVEEGVDILDIGGRSSRPESQEISEEEEIQRVAEIISFVVKKFPSLWISIDTTKASVAKFAVDKGCRIVNDISAGNMDPLMLETVADLKVPFVCMHMQGTPDTMQKNPTYNQITEEIVDFFAKKIAQLELIGIDQVIIDPGFGFGKTIEHNYQLMKEIDRFVHFNKPLLVGISRKSMIYKLLNSTPEDSLNGTNALNMFALMKGANILRVHDVRPAKEIIQIFQQLNT